MYIDEITGLVALLAAVVVGLILGLFIGTGQIRAVAAEFREREAERRERIGFLQRLFLMRSEMARAEVGKLQVLKGSDRLEGVADAFAWAAADLEGLAGGGRG